METRSGCPRWISRFESDKDTFTAACLHNREVRSPIVNSASVHRRLPSGKHAEITFERRAKPHCSTGKKNPTPSPSGANSEISPSTVNLRVSEDRRGNVWAMTSIQIL